MLNKLREINKELLSLCQGDEEKKKKYEVIAKLLSDERLFFEIDIEYAYAILRDLKIDERALKEVYLTLLES